MSDWKAKPQPEPAVVTPCGRPLGAGLVDRSHLTTDEGVAMGKRARKKKDRRKNKANHGKRPNS